EEINKVTSDYDIVYELIPAEGDAPRSFEHLAQILLIDQGGEVRGAFLGGTSAEGDVIPPAFLAEKISTLLTGVGEPLANFGPASEFELTNQNGKRVKLSDFQGRVVVMTFFYTTCPVNFCPLLNANLMQARDSLDEPLREKVVLLSITFDPEVDTPAVLKKYAKERGFK
ncbi:MAG: SCO family protein, partial [Chloroflexota bacterium]